MHDPIWNDAAHRFSIPFLLVSDVVLCASLHSRLLHTLDRFTHGDTGKIGIHAEAFPVPPSSRDLAEGSRDWAELYVDTELLRFCTEE